MSDCKHTLTDGTHVFIGTVITPSYTCPFCEHDRLTSSLLSAQQSAEHNAKALAERDVEVARLREQIDGRIKWQVDAVEHLRTWSGLFDAAVAMREGHEGCITEPPCDGCFRCSFDSAVDEAMNAVSANSPGSIIESYEKGPL